jgi:hypothetical protein
MINFTASLKEQGRRCDAVASAQTGQGWRDVLRIREDSGTDICREEASEIAIG